MAKFLQTLRDEPAVVVGVVVAALSLFGVRVSDEQASTVTQLLVALAPLVGSLVVRSQVSPVSKP